MRWCVEFAAQAEQDFALILDHLVESYAAFGETQAEAETRAAQRIEAILEDSCRIATAPHRGSRHDDLIPGLRQLMLGKAIVWFIADESSGLIRILAVFFGAQDQQRRMLISLLERRRDR
ncbi:MAG: type II toxin-antitoxin system RelE/ParE family toxin [Rhodobacterales bacterium]|nr:type II toxin-antitoxin system RelE/ParE family toxin [Rhodobacterales bacterium]MDX5498516.1 type II toxin-antitoxin system RelE/ParE family toxin [Rhodobacterales bacterium]